MDLNVFAFTGRLGRDAKQSVTKNGTDVTSFPVAISGFRDATIWVGVRAFGKLAEVCAGLSKGERVAVSGELSLREYEGKTYLDVSARSITFLTPKGGGNDDDIPF